MHLRVIRLRIADGVYENIITNLPEGAFPLEEIKRIYNLRWEIETSFRDLKHTIGTANFHSKSPEYIEFEILCRMTLYNFCTIITVEVPMEKKGGKWEYQVNLSMAIKICFAFLNNRVAAENVNALISKHILPIRPAEISTAVSDSGLRQVSPTGSFDAEPYMFFGRGLSCLLAMLGFSHTTHSSASLGENGHQLIVTQANAPREPLRIVSYLSDIGCE